MTELATQLKQIQTDYPWLKRVEITYSGSNDEGNVEVSSINGFSLDSCISDTGESLEQFDEYAVLHIATADETKDAESLWLQLSGDDQETLTEAFDDIAAEILSSNDTGYFDAEGGCDGVIGLDVKTGHYAIADRIYYLSSDSNSGTGAITQEGLGSLDD